MNPKNWTSEDLFGQSWEIYPPNVEKHRELSTFNINFYLIFHGLKYSLKIIYLKHKPHKQTVTASPEPLWPSTITEEASKAFCAFEILTL